MKDVFEFKGVMYERRPNWVYPGTVSISVVGQTPDFRTKNVPKEVIPNHLRYLNKRQLRERLLVLENLVKEQGKLLKEFEKDRLV